MARYPVEHKGETRQRILAASEALMKDRGVEAASVDAVMRGAGLTVGGFYAHFASKEAMIDTTLRRASREMRARLFARLDAVPEGDRADVVLKRYLSGAHRDDLTTGCALPAVVGEVATTAAEHAPALGESVDAFAAELERHLPATDKLSRRHLALGTLALMYGGLSLARALRGSELSDEILRACRALGRLITRAEPT